MNEAVQSVQKRGSHWRTRARASAIHATASVSVALLAALLVRTWYPWPYTKLAGGLELFVLVCGVDVVLGPVITFAIFDLRKGWGLLRRDLTIVVLLQLAALGYGLHVVFVARPVVLALEGERLRVVSAVEVEVSELPQAPPSLRTLSMRGPHLVWTTPPSDAQERYDAIVLAAAGVDLGKRPRYWREWDDEGRSAALAIGRPLARLHSGKPEDDAILAEAVARTGRGEAQLLYLPVFGKNAEWVALLDAATGDPVGFAPLIGD